MQVLKGKSLPSGYLEKLEYREKWWRYLGQGWLARTALRWWVVEAFVEPHEFAQARLRSAFQDTFGDTQATWQLTDEKVQMFLEVLLNMAPFSQKRTAQRMWRVAFDTAGANCIKWFHIQSIILQHHEQREQRERIMGQKVVHTNRLLPKTWLTNNLSRLMMLLSAYYFVLCPLALAFREITWVADWWQVREKGGDIGPTYN
eukprot:3616936-Pyramimonas_sp.AAC.1